MDDFLFRGGRPTRRAFLGGSAAGLATLSLSACTTIAMPPPETASGTVSPPSPPQPAGPPAAPATSHYAARVDEGYQLPAIPVDRIDPRYLRQEVDDPTGEKPGTIVVDTSQHFLYLVQPGGRAMRYGVSLGKAGFGWSGSAVVQWKKKWPVWTPPPEMIKRKPELEKYRDGMPPGPDNPLGARAMYLFRDGKDTMYRLHGTPEWNSIGKNASSGCVRFMNQDIIDLYSRVNGVAPVHVRAGATPAVRVASAAMMSRAAPAATTEAIDAGVPEDAEMLR